MNVDERLKKLEDELVGLVRALAEMGALVGESMRLMGNLEFRIEALESLASGPLCAELEEYRGRVLSAAQWALTKLEMLGFAASGPPDRRGHE